MDSQLCVGETIGRNWGWQLYLIACAASRASETVAWQGSSSGAFECLGPSNVWGASGVSPPENDPISCATSQRFNSGLRKRVVSRCASRHCHPEALSSRGTVIQRHCHPAAVASDDVQPIDIILRVTLYRTMPLSGSAFNSPLQHSWGWSMNAASGLYDRCLLLKCRLMTENMEVNLGVSRNWSRCSLVFWSAVSCVRRLCGAAGFGFCWIWGTFQLTRFLCRLQAAMSPCGR